MIDNYVPPVEETVENINYIPCHNLNSTWLCEESGCNNSNVLIESGVLMLFISFIFGVGLIKKRFVLSRYM